MRCFGTRPPWDRSSGCTPAKSRWSSSASSSALRGVGRRRPAGGGAGARRAAGAPRPSPSLAAFAFFASSSFSARSASKGPPLLASSWRSRLTPRRLGAARATAACTTWMPASTPSSYCQSASPSSGKSCGLRRCPRASAPAGGGARARAPCAAAAPRARPQGLPPLATSVAPIAACRRSIATVRRAHTGAGPRAGSGRIHSKAGGSRGSEGKLAEKTARGLAGGSGSTVAVATGTNALMARRDPAHPAPAGRRSRSATEGACVCGSEPGGARAAWRRSTAGRSRRPSRCAARSP